MLFKIIFTLFDSNPNCSPNRGFSSTGSPTRDCKGLNPNYISGLVQADPWRTIRTFSSKPEWDMELTPIQREVLVGSLLGDLFIAQRKSTHNSSLEFKQTSAHIGVYSASIRHI